MREDRVHGDGRARGVLRAAARGQGDPAARVDPVAVQVVGGGAGHRVHDLLGRGDHVVVAHRGDAHRAPVEPARVRAQRVRFQGAAAALVDVAEAVRDQVVREVAPAEGLRVVRVDAAHLLHGLGARVVVGAGRVVDGQRAHLVELRGVLRPGLVRAPLCAGDHVRKDLRAGVRDRGHGAGLGGLLAPDDGARLHTPGQAGRLRGLLGGHRRLRARDGLVRGGRARVDEGQLETGRGRAVDGGHAQLGAVRAERDERVRAGARGGGVLGQDGPIQDQPRAPGPVLTHADLHALHGVVRRGVPHGGGHRERAVHHGLAEHDAGRSLLGRDEVLALLRDGRDAGALDGSGRRGGRGRAGGRGAGGVIARACVGGALGGRGRRLREQAADEDGERGDRDGGRERAGGRGGARRENLHADAFGRWSA